MNATTRPPNVLMVLADQHHAGLLGCVGHPQALTPRLDAFAAEAFRFDAAYCPNPVCTPSRTSILSGQHCHNHGCFGLSGPTPRGLPSLFSHFRAAGYRTAAYGKLHLPCRPRNWIADHVDELGDAYETPDGVIGRSEYLDHLTSLGLREREDSWHNTWNYGAPAISLDAMPSLLPYEHTMEQWCVDRLLRFLDAAPDRPFCAQVAFQKPHHPLLPQRRFWEMYPEDLELPAGFHHEPTGRSPAFQTMWRQMRTMRWDFARPGDDAEAGPRRAWRGTLACITQIDDVFGRLRDELERRGLWEDTIVVYSSDHGAYHGLRGIPEKAPGICSEDVCRVPLLLRAPGLARPGGVTDALVQSVDLAPTLAAACGLPPMDTADGSDLGPLLRGEVASVHEAVVTENAFSKAIRWGRWRYVHYPRVMFGGACDGELYDLDADPEETRNLIAEPSARAALDEGRRRLVDWLVQTTRVVTSHPAAATRRGAYGRDDAILMEYPLAADGRAPAAVQPVRRADNNANYL